MADAGKQREIASLLRGAMLTCAVSSNVRFINWSQFTVGHNKLYDDWIGRGLCQGLSAKYLDCIKRGTDFVSEVNLGSLIIPKQYGETALHKEIFAAAIPGNFGNKDIAEMKEFMKDTYGFKPSTSHTWKTTDFLGVNKRFADFVTSTSHYYMISWPGHALAASATKGEFHFFDPNCGIARTSSGSAMRTFLTTYTRHEYTKKIYGKGNKFEITATRYS